MTSAAHKKLRDIYNWEAVSGKYVPDIFNRLCPIFVLDDLLVESYT